MYVDARLLFSDAQAVTADAGSSSTLDMGLARNIGVGENLYVVLCVDVAMADTGSNSTCTVTLEGDSTESFSPDGSDVLFVLPAVTAAGSTFIARINPDFAANYRYLRLKYTMTNGDLSAGTFTAFIAKDVQKYTSYADAITIS